MPEKAFEAVGLRHQERWPVRIVGDKNSEWEVLRKAVEAMQSENDHVKSGLSLEWEHAVQVQQVGREELNDKLYKKAQVNCEVGADGDENYQGDDECVVL